MSHSNLGHSSLRELQPQVRTASNSLLVSSTPQSYMKQDCNALHLANVRRSVQKAQSLKDLYGVLYVYP